MSQDGAAKGAINSSAQQVFDVLRFVTMSDEPLGVTEIGRQLSLPVSSVFRALTTLEDADFIRRYQTSPKFETGTVPHLLTRAMIRGFALHDDCLDLVYDLADKVQDTVTLRVRLGWYSMLVCGGFGLRDAYHAARLGEFSLLGETVPGRVILRELNEVRQAAYHRFVGTHFSKGADGTAHDIGADAPPTLSLPVRSADRTVLASLSVEGPSAVRIETVQPKLVLVRDAIEAMIDAAPARYKSPFAHIPDHEIVLAPGPYRFSGAQ